MAKAVLIILALLGAGTVGCVALLGIGAVAASNTVDDDGRVRMPTFGGEPVITLAEYELLVDGISYEEAVEIIGAPGAEQSSSTTPPLPGHPNGMRTAMYAWTNPGGSNAMLTFQDGKLMSRAQFGLP